MLMPMPVFEWQVLRAVKRAGEAVGRSLRLSMSRRTRDGSFLTDMVAEGWLEVVRKADDPFEATYRLTKLGEHAAEYGECEKEIPHRRID